MEIEEFLRDQIRKLDNRSPQNNQCTKALLECLASITDNDINKKLLRELLSKYALAEKQLKRLNTELIEKQHRLNEDLEAAAEIQKSLLPQEFFLANNIQIAWRFKPCEQMGGDIFNIFQLDAEHIGVYMLDVSGHGVTAAMITVSVSQFLQQNSVLLGKHASFRRPAQILNALDKEFPFERFSNFFTITYMIINTKSGDMTYSNAGHPYPILLRKGETVELLKKGGPCIGISDFDFVNGREIRFEEGVLKIHPGDKLFVYTDGIVEYQNRDDEFYGYDRFYKDLKSSHNESVHYAIDQCIESLMEFGKDTMPQDDITLLGLELK